MIKVYVGEQPPDSFSKSLFLAGPTPRRDDVPSWRPEALALLEKSGYDGVVFIPERENGGWLGDYTGQVEWEETYLNMADIIVFWIDRNMDTMPALTTNDEWGVWKNSGKVVLGTPETAVHVSYQRYYAKKYNVRIAYTLEDTLEIATEMIPEEGFLRTGGERFVPIHIWRTKTFGQWYSAQIAAGNRLDGARVEWTFRVGLGKKMILVWILHVDIFVTSENRHKANEIVIARPDISTIVMYRKRDPLPDSEIVLIREFRSPVSNESGFVWEVAGGSSFKGTTDPKIVAADECKEEAGITIDPQRIKQHETRQMVAALSTHRAHLFSVEITEAELAELKAKKGTSYGVTGDTEQTYVEVVTLREILDRSLVDWSMLGMILSVLQK